MRMRSVVPAVALALSSGCALWPRFGPPPMVGPPLLRSGAQADSAATAAMSADSAAAALNEAMTARLKTGKTIYVGDDNPTNTSTPPPARPRAPKRSSETAADSSAEVVAPADTISAAPATDVPALSVDLPASDRSKLEGEARANAAWADSTARVLTLRPQLDGRDRDKLETAFGLVTQSREALDRGDVQAAANLAYKAKLLVEEVAKK
jgi:hypothetical protein